MYHKVAEASIPFSPSLCAFFRLLNNSNCRTCLCGGVRSGAELPCTPQLPHGFSDSSVSLSLPHYWTARRLISVGLWDAEPGMEREPGLVKPCSEGKQERRRGLCWRVDIMKNYQWQGVSSNYSHERVFFLWCTSGDLIKWVWNGVYRLFSGCKYMCTAKNKGFFF